MNSVTNKNRDYVEQTKLNALCAKYLHQKKLNKLTGPNFFIDYMVMAVTVLYFPIRYLAKGTAYSSYAETGWEFSAAILFIFSLIKTVYKWQDRINKHNKLMLLNMSLVSEADEILNSENINPELFRFFSSSVNNLESEDREALGQISEKDKKWGYREAIKEFYPAQNNSICPQCKASPWNYKKGSCQLCGNTPAI